MTVDDHMRAAFKALLAGDMAERERQSKLAEELLQREKAEQLRLCTLTHTDNLTTQ